MPDDIWDALPAELREEADGQVLRDARMTAVHVLVTCGVSLRDAQIVVERRYAHHGERVARRPEPPLDITELAALAPARVVEIAAEWDGDTVHDWFVELVAVTARPAGSRALTTVTWGAARRHLGDEETGPRHPAAVVAERIGSELAARLAVPFRFDSPDEPEPPARRQP
ncbi:hypothetical protein GTY65_04250 [Streptomyces sp. SID8379]|uniref:hypothetical protein n=1 Tax=unclassified Streptomyces TaxID=2593676 RepID=UPI00036E8829|nr:MULTISPECIES: hypothetical protein [unclassified Streptomyces]MYW63294.1 hypothetical protein [Streptomyces sp. SID8379]